MKSLFLIFAFMPMTLKAQPCAVYGISDSPQSLKCYVTYGSQIEKLTLSCHRGTYILHWRGEAMDVENAYHEEVERGSSPLVFEARDLSLTSVSQRVYSLATLRISKDTYQGLCFD